VGRLKDLYLPLDECDANDVCVLAHVELSSDGANIGSASSDDERTPCIVSDLEQGLTVNQSHQALVG
jgi:hypothetical protein